MDEESQDVARGATGNNTRQVSGTGTTNDLKWTHNEMNISLMTLFSAPLSRSGHVRAWLF